MDDTVYINVNGTRYPLIVEFDDVPYGRIIDFQNKVPRGADGEPVGRGVEAATIWLSMNLVDPSVTMEWVLENISPRVIRDALEEAGVTEDVLLPPTDAPETTGPQDSSSSSKSNRSTSTSGPPAKRPSSTGRSKNAKAKRRAA